MLGADEMSFSGPARDWLLRAAMLASIGSGDFQSFGTIDHDFGERAMTGNQLTRRYRAYPLAFARQQASSPSTPPPAQPIASDE